MRPRADRTAVRALPGLSWLRQHDPGLLALRRAGRTAIVMPAAFAVGKEVIGGVQVATFAAFGSFAMLLLVDFAGPISARALAQAWLTITGAGLISVATLVSPSPVLAVAAMALVGFAVLFAGVVSSVLAGATTSLLLAFILPLSLPGPVSSIPERLLGWGLAGAASLAAVALLWPAPARDPVRTAAIAGCRALAARMRSHVAYIHGREPTAEHAATIARADAAVATLHDAFFSTPYRPTGLSTAARAVVRLVDELRWLNTIIVGARPHPVSDTAAGEVKLAAAAVLDSGADLVEAPHGPVEPLHAAVAELRDGLGRLERSVTRRLPSATGRAAADAMSSLDPSFRAQELSFVVLQIAANIDIAAAAERRSWLEQLMGRQPAGVAGPLSAAQERAGSHIERHSVWLRNSVRGGAGLAIAVAIASLTGVQHSFWVVLGTLSVLRSNALSTGQSVVRAVLGTTAGFVAGAVLVVLVGTDTTVLWLLLPVAVFLAGLAPAAVSFAGGQAAFTLTLLILFNILAPEGWQIGLVRIEDVALGGLVSLAVGALFWPRGAGGALGQALAEAYADSARYLASAVRSGLRAAPVAAGPEAMRAAAAARRLDDTFRNYLAERGAKPVPLAEVTSLVTGVVGLRLAGDAVLDLWRDAGAPGAERSSAAGELLAGSETLARWYGDFAESLAGRGDVPAPSGADGRGQQQLLTAVGNDLHGRDGNAGATAVRMVWTGDHLDAARRLEDTLTGPAKAAVGEHALG